MKSYTITFSCNKRAGFEDRTYGAHLSNDDEAQLWADLMLQNPNHFALHVKGLITWFVKSITSHTII